MLAASHGAPHPFFSRLAHRFSEQPCQRHRGGRPFCPSNDRIPNPLCLVIIRHGRRFGCRWGNGNPDCGVDLAPDHRGFPWDHAAAIPHSGSGHLVRASLRAASARHGYSRSADCVPITWQNAYVERLIGSIRRECLDHMIVFVKRTCAGFWAHMPPTIMSRGPIVPDRTRPFHRAIDRLGAITSHPILVAFTTNIAESNFRYTQAKELNC